MKLLKQIGHSIGWRIVHYYYVIRDIARSRYAQARVAWDWRFGVNPRPHNLPAQLVVSLTSYPPRFPDLALTLRSLLRQTVKADHTILWIAPEDMALLPKEVTDLKTAGLEIRAAENTKSYKKILPALDAFPDAFIVTADDEVYYRPTWLEDLVKGYNPAEPIVTCHRANKITLDTQSRFQLYKNWLLDIREREKSKLIFPTGVGGVLYPPGILKHTPEDRAAALSLCPHGDDIWLYWIGRRNGATYKTVGYWREVLTWRGSQDQGLWFSNVLQGGNDEQIQKIAEKYGFPA